MKPMLNISATSDPNWLNVSLKIVDRDLISCPACSH